MRLLVCFALGLLAACSEGPPLQASDAWIRAVPPGAGATAGYLRLTNGGDSEVLLELVSSPAIERIEIHETSMSGGVMRMRGLDKLSVPPRGQVELAPGGRHLMMFSQRLPAAGERVPLVLHFSDGSVIDIDAEVRRETR